MTMEVLEIDKTYTETEVVSQGLVAKNDMKLSSKVFMKNNEVYFFENLKNNKLRLFSVINKRSFFL
jgi:hypothetical protein